MTTRKESVPVPSPAEWRETGNGPARRSGGGEAKSLRIAATGGAVAAGVLALLGGVAVVLRSAGKLKLTLALSLTRRPRGRRR